MLKKLEVVVAVQPDQSGDEIYLFHDDRGERRFVLKQIGDRGEWSVSCFWEGSEAFEMLFGSLDQARSEIDKLAEHPYQWFENAMKPAQAVNG